MQGFVVKVCKLGSFPTPVRSLRSDFALVAGPLRRPCGGRGCPAARDRSGRDRTDRCVARHTWSLWLTPLLHADDSPEEEVSLGDMDMEMEMSEDDMAMDQRNSFARYTKLHRKKYESKEEYEQRFGIW